MMMMTTEMTVFTSVPWRLLLPFRRAPRSHCSLFPAGSFRSFSTLLHVCSVGREHLPRRSACLSPRQSRGVAGACDPAAVILSLRRPAPRLPHGREAGCAEKCRRGWRRGSRSLGSAGREGGSGPHPAGARLRCPRQLLGSCEPPAPRRPRSASPGNGMNVCFPGFVPLRRAGPRSP